MTKGSRRCHVCKRQAVGALVYQGFDYRLGRRFYYQTGAMLCQEDLEIATKANLERRLTGKRLATYIYRDFGSLVSLGEYTTVGSLMGKLLGGAIFVEGLFARLMYISLYRMHLYALHGAAKVFFDLMGRLFTRRTEPRVKLH